MASHSTRAIWRTRRKEESPPLLPLTDLRHLLQVQHLTNRHTPTCQHEPMQSSLRRRRKHFPCWRVTQSSGEVAVMQPGPHFLLRGQSSPALDLVSIAGRSVGPKTESFVLGGRAGMVILHEARSDEEDVADLYIAALRGRSNVQTLVFAGCE